MTTRSAVLLAHHALSGRDVFSAGPGQNQLWIVKELRVLNLGSTALNYAIYANRQNASVLAQLAAGPLDPGKGVGLQLWTVVEIGDTVQCNADGAGLHFWISGALLPARPP